MATSPDDGPRLLAGGNPQITKGDGHAPVEAFVAAMPGWKHDVGRMLDDLVEETVPGVRRAVRWNTPFYGAPDQDGWFLGFHCFDRYVKVTFTRGAELDPPPPVASKHEATRYVHLHEDPADDGVDADQLRSWIEQAAAIPGDPLF